MCFDTRDMSNKAELVIMVLLANSPEYKSTNFIVHNNNKCG